jgi:hypothetical protein
MKKVKLLVLALVTMISFVSCIVPQQRRVVQQPQGVVMGQQPVDFNGQTVEGGMAVTGQPPNQQWGRGQVVQGSVNNHVGQAMPDGRRLLGYATRTHTVTMDDGTVHHFNDEQLREFQKTHGAPRESTVNVDNSKPWFMDHATGMIYAPEDLRDQNGPPRMNPQTGRTVGSLYQPPSSARR